MLAPPALARPNDAAVLAHYLAVADAIELPVVVQDHPASSGVTMTVELLVDDRRRRAVVPRHQARGRAQPAQGRPAVAADPTCASSAASAAIMLLEELRRGAVGTMTGFGFPELLVDIVGAFRAGDEAGARERPSTGSCRSSGSRTSRASTSPSASTSTGGAARSRRSGCGRPAPTLDPGTIADLDAILAARSGLADRLTVAWP